MFETTHIHTIPGHQIIDSLSSVPSPLHTTLFTVGGTAINAFGLIEFLVIVFLSALLGRVSETSVNRIGHKYGSLRTESVTMFGKFIRWGTITVGVLIALSVLGVPVSHLAILASALSVGIGFGLQTIVNNSVAGLILMSERAVRIGDIIKTPSGDIGRVNMVTIRATRIETADGQDIIIPNASLINGAFTNYTSEHRGTRRSFHFSVPYGCDFRTVGKIIEEAARTVPYGLTDRNHEIECGITGFGDYGIKAELVVWIAPEELMEPYRLESAFLAMINETLLAHGIVQPGASCTISVISLPDPKTTKGADTTPSA